MTRPIHRFSPHLSPRRLARSARLCVGLLAGLSAAAPAAEAAPGGPFDQGRIRLALGGGSATSLGSNDTVIFVGLGVGYFVLDGLELGLELDHYFGADPSQTAVSPTVRYVLPIGPVAPYAGAFYRQTFLGDPLDDLGSVGVRGGVLLIQRGSGYIGGGVVYEQYTSGCESNNLESCDRVYPELAFGLAF